MNNYLFCNSKKKLFRYFTLGQDWHECYVVEFMQDANQYINLYWGNYEYVEKDRRIISEMLTISFLPDPKDEWLIICKENKTAPKNLDVIIKEAEKEIEKQIKEYEKASRH